MTAKRFVISSESNQNIYDIEEKCYYSSIDAMKLCELLNELHEENKGIQDKIFKLLDWLETEKGVSRKEIKEWWND